MKPLVVAISGNMGAGKTTLSRGLAQHYNATYLGWDDFDGISTWPEDYIQWFENGRDYTAWDYPNLVSVLQTLKSEQPIQHPVLNNALNPTPLIIFDAPLGRSHTQTAAYIDFSFHISVPLDISLARWLIRNFKNNNKSKDQLIEELEFYLTKSRPLFFDDDLKRSADYVLNGELTVDVLLLECIKVISGLFLVKK